MSAAIPINLICRGERIRAVVDAKVEALVASIGDCGLLNPITVAPYIVVSGGRAQDGYLLIAGLHRLEAMTRMGATEIPATVLDVKGPQAIIAECDENLCGSNLSPAERSMFTKRRKVAYEAIHPETKHGATGNGRAKSPQDEDSTPVDRFTLDAAKKTGVSEQTIQRDAARGASIPEPLLQEIAGTDLDNGKVLDRVAKAARSAKDDADAHARAAAELAAIKREREQAEAHKRNKEADKAIAEGLAKDFADWLHARTDLNELPQVIAWLSSTKAKDVIAALNREAA